MALKRHGLSRRWDEKLVKGTLSHFRPRYPDETAQYVSRAVYGKGALCFFSSSYSRSITNCLSKV